MLPDAIDASNDVAAKCDAEAHARVEKHIRYTYPLDTQEELE